MGIKLLHTITAKTIHSIFFYPVNSCLKWIQKDPFDRCLYSQNVHKSLAGVCRCYIGLKADICLSEIFLMWITIKELCMIDVLMPVYSTCWGICELQLRRWPVSSFSGQHTKTDAVCLWLTLATVTSGCCVGVGSVWTFQGERELTSTPSV